MISETDLAELQEEDRRDYFGQEDNSEEEWTLKKTVNVIVQQAQEM